MKNLVTRHALACAVFFGLFSVTRADGVDRPKSSLPPSRVFAYDIVHDRFSYYEGIVTNTPNDLRGEVNKFYPHRLNQYHYMGKRGTGGIYDAIRGYQEAHQLDPRRYRYFPR